MTTRTLPADYDGSLAVLVDREARRSIFFMAADRARDADVAVMAVHGRGVCTVTINEGTALRLGLRIQGRTPQPGDTPYYVNSVEALSCEETGISARERGITMRALAASDAVAEDLTSPGHVMVQVARNVLRQDAGPSETANALLSALGIARFAGWIDILGDDGDVVDADTAIALAERLGRAWIDADDVRRFARDKLGAWDEVVRFSAAHFGAPRS